MNLLAEPHVTAFCWILILGGLFLTLHIMQRPCEGPKQAIVFYLALPFMTIIMIVSLPWAYYKALELLWRDEVKKKRLQVKRR